jgi:hypothetical protein
MIRPVLVALLLAAFPLALARADDQQPAKKAEKEKKKPEAVKSFQTTRVGQWTGKIAGTDESSFTFEVGTGPTKRTYDLTVAEDAKIRLPAQMDFDSKGKPKPLKKDPSDPDRNMPGVRGTKDDLHEGQNVIVTIGRLPNKKLVATVVLVLAEKK